MPKATKKRRPKPSAHAWFVKVRGSYLPASPAGWLSYIPYVAYLVFATIVGWRDTSTHAQAVLFIVPNWVAAAVVMTWLAKAKS